MLAAQFRHRHTAFSLPQDRPSRRLLRKSLPGSGLICASVYLLVFIQNLLVYLAVKILLSHPTKFGGDYPPVPDGKGRCIDNFFIERLWQSLK